VKYGDVELGDELPEWRPDVAMEKVRRFVAITDLNFPRFTDHEYARAEGLPGALVPGIMSQGFLAAMIHAWAPGCTIRSIDTVFRTPIVVGTHPTCSGAVTDTDDDAHTIEIDLTIVNEDGSTGVLGTANVELPA
jgi:acyl-CoA hydrolase